MIRTKALWGLLVLSGISLLVPAHAYQAGDRVFIPLFAENLRDDGYAIGRVQRVLEDGRLDVVINEFVEGKGKTLYGTCSPNSATALAGARIVSSNPDQLRVEHEMDPADVRPWRAGMYEYLERENLATVISKWLSDGMAITPNRLDIAERRARALGLDHVVVAVDIARDQVRSTGGGGFPVSAEMALANAPQMLRTVAAKLEAWPKAVDAAAKILAGTEPMQGDDVLASVIARLAIIVREQLREVEARYSSPNEALQVLPNLLEVYDGWYRVMTANDSQPYLNADVAYYAKLTRREFDEGRWPVLY